MLQIIATLCLGRCFPAGNSFVARAGVEARNAVHLLLVLFIGAAVYTATLLATINLYAPDRPSASLVYSFGLGLGSCLAIWAATLVAPVRLVRTAMLCVGTAAVLLPLGLCVAHMAAGVPGTARYVLYLLGSVGGGIVAFAPMGRTATPHTLSRA